VKRSSRSWDRDEVLRGIRALAARGVALNTRNVARKHSGLGYAGKRYFGNWENAITAAGLDYGEIRRKGFWSRAKIVAQIQALSKTGKPLNVVAARKTHGALANAANAYFGSWRKAVEAAGLDYADIRRGREWSKELIVKEIKRLRREGVEVGLAAEIRVKHSAVYKAVAYHLGGWRDALEAAGLERLWRRSSSVRPRK
jgi:hypothetical protein